MKTNSRKIDLASEMLKITAVFSPHAVEDGHPYHIKQLISFSPQILVNKF